MLVMIDGRSVYTPLFSGVFWDVQDLVLADVDRIEVIRGPGRARCGAPTPSTASSTSSPSTAAQTAGHAGRSSAAATSWARPASATARAIGSDSAFRVYGKYRYRDSQRFATGASARDPLRSGQAGFRLDRALSGRTLVTLQGDVYQGRIGISDRPDSEVAGGNVLGRITQTLSSGIADCSFRRTTTAPSGMVPRQFAEHRDTVDLDAAVPVHRRQRVTTS